MQVLPDTFFTEFVYFLFLHGINAKSMHLWEGYLMLHVPLKFHQDFFIRVKATGYNLTQRNSGQTSNLLP